MARAQITTCPHCHRSLPDFSGWPAWCSECGWGLDSGEQAAGASSRFERWWQRRRAGTEQAELQRLLADPALLARGHPRSTAIYAAAIAVHLVTLALLAAGAWVIATDIVTVLKVGAAIIILGLVTITFPIYRLRPPTGAKRADAPSTLQVAAAVAESVGVRAPTRVRVTSYNEVAPPTSARVLTIDTVCWRVLDGPGRIALLAHERAHHNGRDPRRTMLVTLASETLDGWLALLRPDPRTVARRQSRTRIWRARGGRGPASGRGIVVLSELILPIVIAPIYAVVLALGFVLRRGGAAAGLRAELYADALAAEAGGAGGIRGVRELIDGELAEVAVAGDPTTPVADLPELERERRRRVAIATASRIDGMHPTFAARLEMLAAIESRPLAGRPSIGVSSADLEAMTRELVALSRPNE